MTTVAWDGTTLAADTQADAGGAIFNLLSKIRQLPDGRLLGFSGTAATGFAMMDWIENGGDRPKGQDDDDLSATILEIKPNGSILRHERAGSLPIRGPCAALGTGAPYALTAMHLGKTAEEAVRIAMVFDTYTGGKVVSLRMEPSKQQAQKKRKTR